MFHASARRGGMPPKRSKAARGLTLVAVFTLVMSFGCGLWYTYTNGYSAVVNLDDIELIQLEPPKNGDPVAIMHTTAGDMKYCLYPSKCPQAVENFVQLAESGYYDDTFIFTVEKGVLFAGGAPNPDGSLHPDVQNDAKEESVPRELSEDLWPLRGALCALKTKTDGGFFRTLAGKQQFYNGSRFLVADSIEMTADIRENLLADEEKRIIAEAFLEYGGIPNYSQQMTVFGQLYDGFEVLDAITDTELIGEKGAMRPKEEIRIESIEIDVYSEETGENAG